MSKDADPSGANRKDRQTVHQAESPGTAGQRRRSRRAAEGPVDAPPRVSPAAVDPALPSRRALRQAQRAAGQEKAPNSGAPMSVNDALAARQALADDARAQAGQLAGAPGQDPLAVDPEVLARQRELADRAAALNQSVGAPDATATPSGTARPVDPTAAHNLAMVTPLEFVRVPGVDRPVMRPPSTSHIPVITRSQVQARPATPGPHVPPAKAAPPEPQLPGVQPFVLPHMDEGDMPPLPAGSAHGLEPLDAITAGLGRAQRMRLIQWVAIALGVVALVFALTIIIRGLSS